MKMLEVKYKCLHPSCIVNCRTGVLTFSEETYAALKAFYNDETTFRSPKGVCRMGFNQPYKAEQVADFVSDDAAHFGERNRDNDPIVMLVAEHQDILNTLAKIEDEIRVRDVNALWVSTAQLENELIQHSVRKEEDVLFPLLSEFLPLADGLVSIVKEDHREVMTLLHSFRTGLADSDILNGLGLSIIVSLRSHIRKEDNEFFDLIDKSITDDNIRKELLAGFKQVAESFVPVVADEASRELARKSALARGRSKFEDEILAAKEAAANSAGGCCH
ncbi:hemerythrin domain-containing protein [bacterium]|nr:MAG: hemerythrin domain-containing protein [bacterium]